MGIKNAPGILLRHYSGMESQAAVHMLSLWKAGYERRAIIPWSLSVAYLVLDFSVIVIRMALAMQGASVGFRSAETAVCFIAFATRAR